MLYVTIQVQQTFLSLKVTDTKQIKFFNTELHFMTAIRSVTGHMEVTGKLGTADPAIQSGM